MRRGDLLRPQRLLDGDGIACAALGRGVVGAYHALDAAHHADAVDARASGRLVVVHVPAGERTQLQERRARVEQQFDALAGQQLAARDVALAGAFAATLARLLLPRLELVQQSAHSLRVPLELGATGIDGGGQDAHRPGIPGFLNSSNYL